MFYFSILTQTQALTNSAEKFCTESGVLSSVVDPADAQAAEKLRSYTCDTLNMNVTVLLNELLDARGFRRLLEDLQVSLECNAADCCFHITLSVVL